MAADAPTGTGLSGWLQGARRVASRLLTWGSDQPGQPGAELEPEAGPSAAEPASLSASLAHVQVLPASGCRALLGLTHTTYHAQCVRACVCAQFVATVALRIPTSVHQGKELFARSQVLAAAAARTSMMWV